MEGIKEEVVLSPAHALSLIASGEGTYFFLLYILFSFPQISLVAPQWFIQLHGDNFLLFFILHKFQTHSIRCSPRMHLYIFSPCVRAMLFFLDSWHFLECYIFIYVEIVKLELSYRCHCFLAEHRHVGSNNFNLVSSRSHTIFTLVPSLALSLSLSLWVVVLGCSIHT